MPDNYKRPGSADRIRNRTSPAGYQGQGRNAPAGSTCYCPQCGTIAPHTPKTPCVDTKCPNCGSPMTRKF